MWRKLIVLALTTGLAKKAYDYYRHQKNRSRNPFPTAKNHPPVSGGRTRRGRA